MNPLLRPLTLAAALLFALPSAAQKPPEGPPGDRIKLTDGQLFIPEDFKPEGETVPLTLHLHGAFWAAEKNQVLAKQPGVLVTVVLPGLSAVYHQRFKDPQAFRRILDEATATLREKLGRPQLEIGAVTVTSFSAGFGGVRQMLQDPPTFDRISTVVLADSLYAGFIGDPAKREVDPTNMEAFLHFAREAVTGKKRFVLTHTQLFTPTYASTVDTADYLLKALGGERKPVERDWGGELTELGEWSKGNFLLYSFKGDTGPEHMLHLRNLWQFLVKARGSG
jgi:hypothetical protein